MPLNKETKPTQPTNLYFPLDILSFPAIFLYKLLLNYKFGSVKSYLHIISKVGNLSRGWPEGSLFNSYYTKV